MLNEQTSPETYLAILNRKEEPAKSRMDALFFLAQAYEPQYFEVFLGLLNDPDENHELRSAIAITFGKLGQFNTAEQNPFLIALLQIIKDDDVRVKNYAAQGLGVIGREEAIPPLISLLKADDNTLFSSAAEAIGKIGEPATPYLLELLESGADDAQCVAAWKLGEIKSKEAISPIIDRIKVIKNMEVMALCIWALGEIGHYTDEVVNVLRIATSSQYPDIADRAKAALQKVVGQVN